MNSDNENNSGKFKILIGVLSLLLIALAVYTVTLFKDSKNTISSLEIKKADIEEELEGLIANYDDIIEENELKDKEIISARERITVLLDSIKDAEANLALIERYKTEIDKLKRERSLLFKRADSLIAANKKLADERDSTTVQLISSQILLDSVNRANESMSETLKRVSVLKARGLKGEAVIIRRNGKVVSTTRSSRADKIRACFTLVENEIASAGNRTLYLQVINPKHNIMGNREHIEFQNEENLFYSASIDVFYENEELDVCIMVDVDDNELIEGEYNFIVFDGGNKIASTTMILR